MRSAHRRHLLPLTATLALLTTSCVEQERWLYTRVVEAHDCESSCAPDTCGPQQDRCGQAIDCGPCAPGQCPATLSPMTDELTNPRLLHADEGGLLFTQGQGSTPLYQWSSPPDGAPRELLGGQIVRYDTDGRYLIASRSDELTLTPRPGFSAPSSRIPHLSPPRAARLHRDALWTLLDDALLRADLSDPTALATRHTLDASPRPALLAITDDAASWITPSPEGDLLTQLDLNAQTPTTLWRADDAEIAWLHPRRGDLLVWTHTPRGAQLLAIAPQGQPTTLASWPHDARLLGAQLLADLLVIAYTERGPWDYGWRVASLDLNTLQETTLARIAPGDPLIPVEQPIATNGRCVWIAAQHSPQGRRGRIYWLKLERL